MTCGMMAMMPTSRSIIYSPNPAGHFTQTLIRIRYTHTLERDFKISRALEKENSDLLPFANCPCGANCTINLQLQLMQTDEGLSLGHDQLNSKDTPGWD